MSGMHRPAPDAALLDTEQAATYLGKSPKTLIDWRWRKLESTPPWIKVGGAVRYRRSDLDLWLDSQTHNALVADGGDR